MVSNVDRMAAFALPVLPSIFAIKGQFIIWVLCSAVFLFSLLFYKGFKDFLLITNSMMVITIAYFIITSILGIMKYLSILPNGLVNTIFLMLLLSFLVVHTKIDKILKTN